MLRGADEVIYLPTEQLVAASVGRLSANEGKRPRKKKRFLEEAAVDLYGGFDGFLVRTALIRSEDYDQREAPSLDSPAAVLPLLQHLAYADQEHFVVISINAAGKLLAIHEAAVGGTSQAAVEIKQAIKVAFLTSATSVFIAHNHPSGAKAPSSDDKQLTRAMKRAFDCVGLRLLDHFIIARDGHTSFLESGLL